MNISRRSLLFASIRTNLLFSLSVIGVLFFGNGNCRSQELTPADVAKRMKASATSIRTLEANITAVTKRAFAGVMGLERSGDGRVIYLKAMRQLEVDSERQRIEGLTLSIRNGTAYYQPIIAGFDGEEYRAYNPDPRSRPFLGGVVKAFEQETRLYHFWIPELMGYHFGEGPSRHLWDLLEKARITDDSLKTTGLITLEAVYTVLAVNEMKLIVTVDANHGFLPVRVESLKLRYAKEGVRSRLLEVDEFVEAQPGIWVPVKGRFHMFALEKVLPEGLSRDDIAGKGIEERLAIGVKYVAKPLGVDDGFYPSELIVDKQTLKVNEDISEETFTVVFPDDLRVLDTTK